MDWERIIDTAERIILDGGGNKADLAKILGVRPQYLSDIRSGKSKNPGSDFTLALINKLSFNPEWLETGKGEVLQLKLKMRDSVLFAKYSPILEEIEKIMLLNTMKHDEIESRLSSLEDRLKAIPKTYEDEDTYTVETDPDYEDASYRNLFVAESEPTPEYVTRSIAFCDDVAAGPPIWQSEDKGRVVDVPYHLIKTSENDYYALRVKGNSMIDAFIPDGSMVLIKKSDVPQHGKIQVIWLDDRVTLKRMREDEDHGWSLCYEDGTGRTIPLGENNQIQGTFEAVLPPATRPRMRREN
jgi:SOS-response transcriptional repressor LexA